MFGHDMLSVSDFEVSRKFYDALLDTLGYDPGIANHSGICGHNFYRSPTGNFGITDPLNGEVATQSMMLHIQ